MNSLTPSTPRFTFDNSYARDLEGFYTPWQAATVPEPKLLAFNHALAAELGLDAAAMQTDAGLAILAGNSVPQGATPIALAYAGHQFGGFSPSLGDGRALLLGEVMDANGKRRDLQLKGSGRTPYSRGGDGKAAVGPVLREYLISDAMHALGIPTTRALAAVATGETVRREQPLPGAVLTRIASSHIRVGTFQYFAVRKQWEKVRQLADYAIARHYPAASAAENPYLAFFTAVADAQARLVARWMHVGFIHGVMNTDNMSIAGETIDYGPCAFMDAYDPATVFSSIDAHARYAYANQPVIAQWNLTRLAETLLPIVDADEQRATGMLTNAINEFPDTYLHHWLSGMRAKIGLTTAQHGDLNLINDLFAALQDQNVDYTLFFRRLALAAEDKAGPVKALFNDATAFELWALQWQARMEKEATSPSLAAATMNAVNPLYIPRNHIVEAALSAAVDGGDLRPFNALHKLLLAPFTEIDGHESYTLPAPDGGEPYRTFCGT